MVKRKSKEPTAFTVLAVTEEGEKIEVGPFRTRAAAEAEGKAYRGAGARVRIAEGDVRNFVASGDDDDESGGNDSDDWVDDVFDDDDDDDDDIEPAATHPFFRTLFGKDEN